MGILRHLFGQGRWKNDQLKPAAENETALPRKDSDNGDDFGGMTQVRRIHSVFEFLTAVRLHGTSSPRRKITPLPSVTTFRIGVMARI